MSRIILVTGGNRGIGLEICNQLIQHDHTVIMGVRDVVKGEPAAKRLSDKIDVQALDVTKIIQIQALGDYINKVYGKLDVLINNAGIIGSKNGIADADLTEVNRVLDTNFFGPWRISQLMIPLLIRSKGGHIINVSSGMGELSTRNSNYIGYRFSKTLLNRLTLLLAEELKQKNIMVNAMCPGWVRTKMGGKNATRSVTKGADTAVWLATVSNNATGKFFRDRLEIEW